jgi:hypothetical protein
MGMRHDETIMIFHWVGSWQFKLANPWDCFFLAVVTMSVHFRA